MTKTLKAALLIIGDEILSGRTQDTNIRFIAEKLGAKGIALVEIRVVPDVEEKIVAAVNALRPQADYLFTTGGIGPTHDDITAASMAKAFGVRLTRDARAREVLQKHYGPGVEMNEARLKMTEIPEGAALIANPVSGAPGFHIENVFVMAGVPRIMQGMLEGVLANLKGGAVVKANSITCAIPESKIAAGLAAAQGKYPEVSIGSYPHFKPDAPTSVSFVLRSADYEALKAATREVIALARTMDTGELVLELQVEI